MARDSRYGSTWRRFLKAGAGVGTGGLLAGCTNEEGAEPSADGTTGSSRPTTGSGSTTGADGSKAETGADSGAEGSYSVTMEPVGTVEFDAVPETWVPYTADYADMGVALGRADGLEAIGVRERYGTHYYEELSGVSVDKEELTQLWQDDTGKEVFYELDADVHTIDPNFMINRIGWDRADVDEIAGNVAPFVGNTMFTRVYDWHDYRYYSLYEAFGKMAELFGETERYEAFRTYHDEVLTTVGERLSAETPDVAILYPAGVPPESFYPYLVGRGTQSKQWADLRVGDASRRTGSPTRRRAAVRSTTRPSWRSIRTPS